MPRLAKGPHIAWEKDSLRPDGTLKTRGRWVIRDGDKKHSTGCGLEDREGAERKLNEYLTCKHTVPRDGAKDPASIPVADVLNLYMTDKKDAIVSAKKMAGRVVILLEWWGDKMLSQINGKAARDYVAYRVNQDYRQARPEKTGKPARKVTPQGVRRELEDLRAAVRYHFKEGLCDRQIDVWLPEKGSPRAVFLTRSEVARAVWAAWTMKEVQKRTHDGEPSDDKTATRKRTGKHIARFMLVGVYTGTRHNAICGASFSEQPDRGWIDMEKGVFNRHRVGRKLTKKLQTPARLPSRLMFHLERWKRLGISKDAVIEWNGRAVESVSTGFEAAVRKANLGKHVTPHTLRHTAATWLMDDGHSVWKAAGYLGMSAQVLEATYAKHHPDYQIEMVDAFRSPGVRKKMANLA